MILTNQKYKKIAVREEDETMTSLSGSKTLERKLQASRSHAASSQQHVKTCVSFL